MRLNSPSFHTARVAHGPSQIESRSDRQVASMRDCACITQCSGDYWPRIEKAPGPTPTEDSADSAWIREGESSSRSVEGTGSEGEGTV